MDLLSLRKVVKRVIQICPKKTLGSLCERYVTYSGCYEQR